MIAAAERDAVTARMALQLLLKRSSDVLSGLEDPFAADFGAHRWLSHDREESYSDWLQWILNRGQSTDVLRLFEVDDRSLLGTRCEVVREHCIPEGRLDLIIHFDDRATLVVEIKTFSQMAEHQWTTYPSWHREQRRPLAIVLLAIDQPDDFPKPWTFRSWEQISTELRTWAARWLRENRQMHAIMTLAFCSAVEQNLLKLHASGLSCLRTVKYLEQWLEGYENATE